MSSVPHTPRDTLRTLDTLPLAESHVVAAVRAGAAGLEWLRWLEEIGFLPGESVTVLARAQPGNDPLVVRIGGYACSTIAVSRWSVKPWIRSAK